jgi:hypothetical protein
MMRVSMDLKSFTKTMNNIVEYSVGFLDGTQAGKDIFLENLGDSVISAMANYIDVNARMDPRSLHHVYEWYMEGSPQARLFDLDYNVNRFGLSITATFRQSTTMSKDATRPFYDKARIMESGVPVTIRPKLGGVLKFKAGGRDVFTPNPVRIQNPGGDEVQGSFNRMIDEFVNQYFKQSFLKASGLVEYLENPKMYKREFNKGSKVGRGAGHSAGFRWIINAKARVGA